MSKLRWLLGVGFALAGCSGAAPVLVDSGMPDSGFADSGPDAGPDASAPDSGVADSGPDGGVPDSGPDGGADAGIAAHRPWPMLPGDAVMNPVSLVTIVASNDSEASNLFLFSDALVTSSWWSTLAKAYGSDLTPTSDHLVGPPITADMASSDQVAYIGSVIADAGLFLSNGTRIYLLYLPQGFVFSDANACGHHGHYPDLETSLGDQYAAVRDCTYNNETIFEYQTTSASHEIAEAVTDSPVEGHRFPLPPTPVWAGTVWQSIQPPRVEVADLCEGTRFIEGTSPPFSYQRIWLNSAALDGGDPCIPKVSGPYFNMSIAQDWYSTEPGQLAVIPFTGWATDTRPDWFVKPHVVNGTLLFSAGDYTVQTILGDADVGCGPAPVLNNGASGTLQILVPSGAVSGDWAVFAVHSYDSSSITCWPPANQDPNHWWPVGIYVP